MKDLPARLSQSLKLLSGGIVLALLMPVPAQALMLMNMGATIKGESLIEGYKDWIELESVSWGVSSSYTPPGSHSSGSSVPHFQDLSWSQMLDRSFTGMFGAISTGTEIPEVKVDFLRTGGSSSKPDKYFEMTFNGAHLTSLNMSAGSYSTPSVAGSLAYDKITFEYWTDDKGKLVSTGPVSYDLSEGTGSAADLALLFARGLAASPIAVPIPEPETYVMMLAGLGVLGAVARRRRAARPG